MALPKGKTRYIVHILVDDEWCVDAEELMRELDGTFNDDEIQLISVEQDPSQETDDASQS